MKVNFNSNKTVGAVVGTAMALTPVAAKAQNAERLLVADSSKVAADTVRKSNWMKGLVLEICPSFTLGEPQNLYNVGIRAEDAMGISYRFPKIYDADKFRLGAELNYKNFNTKEALRLNSLYNSPPDDIKMPGYEVQKLYMRVMTDFKAFSSKIKGLKFFTGISNISEGGFHFNDIVSSHKVKSQVKPSSTFANSLTGLSTGIGNETFDLHAVAGLKVANGETPHPALFTRLKMYANKLFGFFTDLSIEKNKPTSVESGVIIRL